MHIWVDADALPAVIKDILFRASQRGSHQLTLIANHPIQAHPSPLIQFMQVSSGFDQADNEIIQRVNAGDLVISADIPLASSVIDKGAICLSPRGELLDKSNISARLAMRDFMDTLRSSGVDTGGQKKFSHKDRLVFANQLDKILLASTR